MNFVIFLLISGVINFEIDKGSITNLNSQFNDNSTMEERVSMLDGIDLKMNIIPPAKTTTPTVNHDLHVSLLVWATG